MALTQKHSKHRADASGKRTRGISEEQKKRLMRFREQLRRRAEPQETAARPELSRTSENER